MDFDKTLCDVIDGYEIKYGIIYGNENIFFIKCGAGGTIPGDDDKYLKMANKLHTDFGATVICSAYPYPSDDYLLQYDEEIINRFITKFKSDYTLNFIGVSRGAYIGLTYLSQKFIFSKMLLINMPLMINFHKSIDALTNLTNTKVLFIYGDKDPSVTYIPYLKLHHNNVTIINGADHTFTGMVGEFTSLVDLL
jgi:pimeloyl-ACP methyl ester carboxylesterase